MIKNKEIKVVAGASVGKLHIMECRLYEDGKRVSGKYINVENLKALGVVKRVDSFNKAEDFLNTEEGLKFYESTPHTPIFGG